MSFVWLNGAVLPAEVARIDPADRGFLLGDGVFETLRATGVVAWHLERHLARMRGGAAVLGFDVGWSDQAISDGVAAVLRVGGFPEAVVRLTLSRGVASRGLLPLGAVRASLLISAGALPAALPGARVVIALGTRRNECSPLARIKSLNYLDSILARQEAVRRGGDEAILLNTQGRVAEGSVGNVFVRAGGKVITPAVTEGALPGIARGLLLEAGVAEEGVVTREVLVGAEGVFLSNSLGLRGVESVDGVLLPAIDLERYGLCLRAAVRG